MNEHWKREILNLLLDKYERTAAYQKGELPDRRVMLRFYDSGKTDFPAYDIDDHFVRTEINETVIAMQAMQWIDYEWMRGDEYHIIRRVWMNISHIEEAYRVTERQSSKQSALSVAEELEQEISAVSTDWIIAYYREIKAYIEVKYRLGNRIPADKSDRKLLYQMLRFIDSHSFTSLTERVFSEKCFGDSKLFETRMKSTLLSIMRKYISREMTDAELLQFIGISRYPEPLELRGSITVNGNDMRVFSKGFCFYSDEIESVNFSVTDTLKKIITIENRANFFAYQQADDELVIYHGGHYSPSKKKLFEKIAAAISSNCVWYHWSDIDLGGFTMLLRLRTEILPTVQPYRMNIPELKAYCDFTQTFSNDYAEKLQKLSEEERLSDCRACINYMLTYKIRLEQEAMLT